MIGENVLNFHASDDCYYEEWFQEVEDGWIAAVNFRDHVLKELELYSPLVGKGHYLVCGDTVVEYIPKQTHRPRPWGPGNNPKTALDEFLKLDTLSPTPADGR